MGGGFAAVPGWGGQQGEVGTAQRRGQAADEGFCVFWLFLHSHDHGDGARGEEAEVLGAAVGVTAAVGVALCHQQVADTEPGNCSREGNESCRGTFHTSTCHLALVLILVKSFLQIPVFLKLFLKVILSAAE